MNQLHNAPEQPGLTLIHRKVLDAYMSYLAQKEWDKGEKVKHLGVSKMTSIINDHVQSSEKKCRVLEYDYIIGVYHQRGHRDLVIVELKSFKVYFYNPLGETTFQRRQVLNGWRFAGERFHKISTSSLLMFLDKNQILYPYSKQ